jgi:hypothetical protein
VSFAARTHATVVASGGPVSLGHISLEDFTLPDAVEIAFKSDGTIDYLGNDVLSGPANWYSPTTVGIGASYDIVFTLTSGDAWDAGLVSGTAYNLGTDRQLTLTATSVDKEFGATVQILLAGTGTVAFTATLSLGVYDMP